MINERKFASQFSNFWRTCLPNLEAVTRSINLGYERASDAAHSSARPDRRDLISETGYRLLCLKLKSAEVDYKSLLPSAEAEARSFFEANVLERGHVLDALQQLESDECIRIAEWLIHFLSLRSDAANVRVPIFRGHGILHACQGDIAIDDVLVEIKYVDRLFRSHDFRQILCYCALEYFQKRNISFRRVVIVNPYLGIFFQTSPAELIYSASGRTEPDFYEFLSYVVSSGEISR